MKHHHHRFSSGRSRAFVAGLCAVFALAAFDGDAFAKRKRRKRRRRKSRAALKLEKAQKQAEEERNRAKIERMAAEDERKRAEIAAAEAKKQAEEAKKQLEALKAARSGTAAAGGAVAGTPTNPGAIPPVGKARWGGFFLSFNVGYSTAGGTDGPLINETNNNLKVNFNTFKDWHKAGCLAPAVDHGCYDRFITTNKGAGVAAALQIGYNIEGYVSFWGDFSWHGSFGKKTETGGAGAAAFLVGFHPLRFWRPDAPVDIRLYGGYGLFEVLYYYEAEVTAEAEGKSWTGTTIPFGLMTEVSLGDVFAIGLDLRAVMASYDRWIYNWDKDIVSELDPKQTTFRFEPRLTLGWHF